MKATPNATLEDSAKNKQLSGRPLSLVAMPIAIIMIAVACGEDEATLEEYFADVNRITEESDKRIQELAGDFSGEFENLDAARESYGGYVAIYGDFVEELDGLDAPSEAADVHKAFVVTSKEVQEQNRARLEKLDQAQDDAALDEIFGADEEYTAALEQQNDACVALREVAEGRGISVPGLANCELT